MCEVNKKKCEKCKHWVRLETGFHYGVCLINKDNGWTAEWEGENCKDFVLKESAEEVK